MSMGRAVIARHGLEITVIYVILSSCQDTRVVIVTFPEWNRTWVENQDLAWSMTYYERSIERVCGVYIYVWLVCYHWVIYMAGQKKVIIKKNCVQHETHHDLNDERSCADQQGSKDNDLLVQIANNQCKYPHEIRDLKKVKRTTCSQYLFMYAMVASVGSRQFNAPTYINTPSCALANK